MLVGVLGVGTATAAPVYTESFDRTVHTLGYTKGSVSFYNQSVGIQGSVKSNTKDCMQVRFNFYKNYPASEKVAAQQTRTACGRGTGTSTDFNFTVDPKVQVSLVQIDLYDNTSGFWLEADLHNVWNCAVVPIC
ncbi:hypothetical protein [Streptomyces sp. NPDC127084]|uniref:hypothetical protein n=1 Tax=Streptomyces sp. NPDC127084 TaxID=3347133 RepID=UPI00364C602F